MEGDVKGMDDVEAKPEEVTAQMSSDGSADATTEGLRDEVVLPKGESSVLETNATSSVEKTDVAAENVEAKATADESNTDDKAAKDSATTDPSESQKEQDFVIFHCIWYLGAASIKVS